MVNSLKKIKDDAEKLYNQHNEILDYYSQHFWKDTRPLKIEKKTTPFSLEVDLNVTTTPEQKKIPLEFKQNYQKWYSSCCALLERNYNKERTDEFKSDYENSIKKIISSAYITRDERYSFIDSFTNQSSILKALPEYLEHRLSDIELTVASTLMDDELLEAEYLIKKGFIRSAGALAGVVLERHLKMRCDKSEPKLRYPKNAGINKLNDILKENNKLDIVDWRKIQYLADIRHKCDHDKKPPPKKEEVLDLISKVKEMIHYC